MKTRFWLKPIDYFFRSTDKPMKTEHRESADIQYGYMKGYVNVTCKALADPPATFQWFRNDKPIKNHLIVNHQTLNGEHVSYLPVKTRPIQTGFCD